MQFEVGPTLEVFFFNSGGVFSRVVTAKTWQERGVDAKLTPFYFSVPWTLTSV
jgi:hypothetical protein